jgi:hypothetical protein
MTAACGLTLFSILNNPFGSLAASAVIFCGIPAFKLFKR